MDFRHHPQVLYSSPGVRRLAQHGLEARTGAELFTPEDFAHYARTYGANVQMELHAPLPTIMDPEPAATPVMRQFVTLAIRTTRPFLDEGVTQITVSADPHDEEKIAKWLEAGYTRASE